MKIIKDNVKGEFIYIEVENDTENPLYPQDLINLVLSKGYKIKRLIDKRKLSPGKTSNFCFLSEEIIEPLEQKEEKVEDVKPTRTKRRKKGTEEEG